jgi:RimJ/RimL family protein N-acetyltransferase
MTDVVLRLLLPDDAALLEAEQTPELDPFNWHGLRRSGRLRARLESGEDVTAERGTFAISDSAGRLLGDISWRHIQTAPSAASSCWDIGVLVLSGERGRGVGSAAQRLVAAYLFDTTLAQRVQASTDIANIAEQRALEKAGFVREGVLRQYQYRQGQWHDMISYSKLRGES